MSSDLDRINEKIKKALEIIEKRPESKNKYHYENEKERYSKDKEFRDRKKKVAKEYYWNNKGKK